MDVCSPVDEENNLKIKNNVTFSWIVIHTIVYSLKCQVKVSQIFFTPEINKNIIVLANVQLKLVMLSLAGVAQWIEGRPTNQSVTCLIPSQGTCLGCGPGPQ